MRSCAELNKIALLIERYLFVFRKVLDELYLVRLILVLVHLYGFFSRKCEVSQSFALLDDLLHLGFDFVEILTCQRRHIEVIVESVFN